MKLTAKGQQFMAIIGARRTDHFDDGIVAGSGNWGGSMADQVAGVAGWSSRTAGGVMAQLAKLGLWDVASDNGEPEAWWSLTALGAEVALAEAAAVVTHKISFWATPGDGSRIRRNSSMPNSGWGWDATCSCGWDSKTGGAIMARVDEAVAAHKNH